MKFEKLAKQILSEGNDNDPVWDSINPNSKNPSLHDQGEDERRSFKRRELEHELGHEKNNVAVSINGKVWKIFPGESSEAPRALARAEKIAAAIRRNTVAKGKKEPKVEVYLTGADATDY